MACIEARGLTTIALDGVGHAKEAFAVI